MQIKKRRYVVSDFIQTSDDNNKPFKLEVTKNTKGYNWVIRVYGDDMEVVKNQVEELENFARDKYGEKPAEA